MNPTTEFNTQRTLHEVVPNVFQTMLGLSLTPIAGDGPLTEANRMGGTVGVAGDTVTGTIYVHLPETLARLAVNAMMGNPPGQTVEENDVNDVVGELTNMIGGGFKSALCDAGRPCAMSTPSVSGAPISSKRRRTCARRYFTSNSRISDWSWKSTLSSNNQRKTYENTQC
ncbi:MAG: chemotaxis protein CheX [Verrucomicrobiota bacterium]